jgi:methyl-accepting chemotaxis protein
MNEQRRLFSRIAEWKVVQAISGSIRNKILVAFLALALIPLIALGIIAYTTASNALTNEAFGELEALRISKTNQIQDWFQARRNDAKTLSENPTTVDAITNLQDAILELGDGSHEAGNEIARALYLDQPDLTDAGDGSAYSQIHARLHPLFVEYMETYGYRDIHLVDRDGDVIYTATKEDDFGTNLIDGLFSESGLGLAFQETVGEDNPDFTMLEDFSIFAGTDERASFVATPILSEGHSGDVTGVLIFEMPLVELNALMQEATGLGETGETYLVGLDDNLWRSDSRFLGDLGAATTILNEDFTVNTRAVQQAAEGESGTDIIEDYRGVSVLSSWAPLVIQPPTSANPTANRWAVIAEMDAQEVRRPVVRIAAITGGIVVGAAVLVVVVALILSGSLTDQVNRIMNLFSSIGIGDFDARTEVVTQDELGTMASSLNAMLDNTLTLIQTREERDSMEQSIMKLLEEVSEVAEGDLTQEAEVTADMTGAIADAFNYMIYQLREIISNVQDATLAVSSSAGEVRVTAENLAQGSEQQAKQISDASSAIGEMSISIQQVSENASRSAAVAEHALDNARRGAEAVQNTTQGMSRIREQVQETSKRIKRLGERSQEIGEIVTLIDDIADRTSILALNASIQAAMAGEAGRGFAVVAEEVERLAERSTEATQQIAALIRTIQSETNEVVTAMESTTQEVVTGSSLATEAGQALTEIQEVSDQLAELIQSISMASKQQARGSEELAGSMSSIANVTQQTAIGTQQAAVSISNLAGLADNLRASVSAFRLPGNGHETT